MSQESTGPQGPRHLAQAFRKSWALSFFLPFLLGASAYSSKKQNAPAVAVEQEVPWEKILIKGEPQPTFRFAVAHQHKATGCYGYLFVTRNEIWFEVKGPVQDKDHAFRYQRSTLTEARQWRFLGSGMPEVEFKFSGGKTYHFFRMRQEVLDDPNIETRKSSWEDVLPWEPLEQATQKFDEMARLAEQRQIALAPKPVPTVTLKAEPGAVEKGKSVTLTWTSNHATSVDLQPGVGPVQANGSTSLSPAESTTYIITALGPGGSNNATERVVVNIPLAPPTIVLIDPTISTPGQMIELGKSPFTIRGVVMDNSGIPSVTINGMPASLRPKSVQAAEFSSDPITLQPGENKIEIMATNASHAEAKVTFVVRYATPEKPQPTVSINTKGLDKDDIIDLLKGAVPSARLADLVKERGVKFVPTDHDLNEIRAAGGEDDLVEAIKQAATTPK